jgi:hypothetical protein
MRKGPSIMTIKIIIDNIAKFKISQMLMCIFLLKSSQSETLIDRSFLWVQLRISFKLILFYLEHTHKSYC